MSNKNKDACIVKKVWMSAVESNNPNVLKKLEEDFSILIEFAFETILNYSGTFHLVDSGDGFKNIRYTKRSFFYDQPRSNMVFKKINPFETLEEVWFEFCQYVGDNHKLIKVSTIVECAAKCAKEVIGQFEARYMDEILAGKYVVVRFQLLSLSIIESDSKFCKCECEALKEI